ncbi:IS66 family transposase [Variovorax sp. OK605]|uniref:IS66 family transposase n=1 Tax=Variovorax sp. OK605 TaxID=1855317 RepID=UPI000B1E5C0C|nr:IS66 family transposase [Variovorax sp. OK605]
MISRFVDRVPYYRQEAINARSGVHTPRSTLASWSGGGGAALEPLFVAQKRFVRSARVLHADETPVAMLDPGAGKPKRPTCGPMREVPSMRCREWPTTSALGEGRSTPSRSSARMMTRLPTHLNSRIDDSCHIAGNPWSNSLRLSARDSQETISMLSRRVPTERSADERSLLGSPYPNQGTASN